MMNEESPPDYESATATRESITPSINREYPKSRIGIIKITEMVVSMITFISSIVNYWEGHIWVGFVSMSAFISSLIYFIFGLVNFYSLTRRILWPWALIEFIYCIIYTVFYLIAALVATGFAARYSHYATVGVTAFFAFLGTAIFLVDTIRQYRAWNTSDSSVRTGTQATTTTTTTHYTTTRYAYNDSDPPKY